ncbi:MAG: tetratricopeptide repeat protein [Pseudomonadota bacterium]
MKTMFHLGTIRLRALFRAPLIPLLALLLLAACDSIEERVQGHYERGMELLAAGEENKAILEFRNALKLDDTHVPSHFELGLIQEAKGNVRPAFRRFTTVIEIEPNHIEARIKTLRYFLLVNQLDDAEDTLDVLLGFAPDNAEAYALEGALSMKLEDLERADKAIARAEELDPVSLDAALMRASYHYETGDQSAALDRVNQALEVMPGEMPLHIMKLQILNRLDNPAAMGVQLAEMVQLFPDTERFRRQRAQWAISNDRLDIAEDELRNLVKPNARDLTPLYDLIRFMRRFRDEDAARAEITRMIGEARRPFRFQLLRAQFDVETGKTDQAVADLRALIDSSGENANRARTVLARLLLAEGERDEAYLLVDEVLADDPTDVDALVMLVARQVGENQLELAITTVRAGLKEAPDDVRLLLLAGRAQELSGNLDLANDRLASAVRAASYDPETVERYVQFLLRSVRFTAAETVLSEAIRRNPTEAQLLDLLGFTRLRLQNWLGAEEAARALEGLDPERARQLKAAILIGQERFDEGASLLRDLPSEENRRAASITALVQTYMRDGQVDEAISFLEGLLAEAPDNLQAIGLRGNIHLASGELEEAEAKFRAILAADPANGGAHSALARLFVARGETEAAERQILTGLDLSPDNLILLARLAQYRESQGRFNEAIDTYERLYERVPDSLLVANNLASLLSDHRADDTASVERAYTIASRLRPSDLPQYRDTYGWTRYLKGEYDVALERIEPVAVALPNNPWVQYHLGMVQAALNQPDAARNNLERALELAEGRPFPPATTIRETLASLVGQ